MEVNVNGSNLIQYFSMFFIMLIGSCIAMWPIVFL